MDFALSDDHLALRDAAARFCAGEYPVGSRGRAEDRLTMRRRHAALAGLGLLGLPFDAVYGGSAQGPVEMLVALQELGRALAAPALLPNAVLAGPLLAECGPEALRSRWLPRLIDGAAQLALACQEDGARHPLQRVATRARRAAGGWRLQGSKTLVLGGDVADLLLVVARTAGADTDAQGLTLFALEPDAGGLQRQPARTLDGRGMAHLDLDDVLIADEQRLGAVGAARLPLEQAMARANAALCAESAGALETLLDLCCEHLRTRRQFGAPLAKFQTLQHVVADMAIALEQLKSMACVAALALEAAAHDRRRLVASAKLLCAQLGRRCALAAIQLHGAMGMTEENTATPYARRLIANGLLFGDAAWQLQCLADCAAPSVPASLPTT